MAYPQITNLNVTTTQAPLPNKLQQSGLVMSCGGTRLPVGTTVPITQVADLTAILSNQTYAIQSISWNNGLVTVTTTTPHGFTNQEVGQAAALTGVVPAAYNGLYAINVPSTTTFVYALPVNPGTATVLGTVVGGDMEVLSMATTFFAQGSAVAFTLLELGMGVTTSASIAQLTTFLQVNPQTYYAVLIPRGIAFDAAFAALCASNEFNTSRLYFVVTVTQANFNLYNAQMKGVVAVMEAFVLPHGPGFDVQPLEFTAAAFFYNIIAQTPSNVQRIGPFCFKFLYGVTQFPIKGNAALLATLKANNVNIVATAAEGGITNTMAYPFTTLDGRDFLYWYSVDWVEINLDLDISNEIINGSNNQINPLYYDQNGIDRLKARALQTMSRAVQFGLALAPVSVNAVTFATYVVSNPSDFRQGVYDGLSTTYTPNRGFQSVTFNVNVTDFPVTNTTTQTNAPNANN